MGLHLLIVLVCLRVVTFIYPVPIYTKDILNHTCFHPWQPSHLKHEPTNLQRMSTHIHTHICFLPKPWEGLYFPYFPYCPEGWSAKTMRGSLFPLFPLFWWSMPCHLVKTWATKIGEIGTLSWSLRGSLFPLFPLRVKCQNHEVTPILVAHVLTGWIDIGHQNRGIRGPLMVFGTSSRENTERVHISPISHKGEVPKPWKGPYFPISTILVVHVLARWKDRPWK